MSTVAVTGGQGWVGRAVVADLVRRGLPVRALGRSGAEGTFDLAAPAGDPQWERALQGSESVVHAAAHVHRPNETPDEVRLFHEVNVEGTRKLLAAAERVGVRRFVFVSSIAVYGATPGAMPDECAPLAPASHYGRSKMEAEELVRASKLDWVIVRPATIFGAGDRANFARLAQALRRGRFIVPGRGAARKSVLPVTLAGELIADAVARPWPARTTWNLALPVAPTLREICDAFSAQHGWPVARSVPLGLLRVGARVGDVCAAVAGRAPLTTTTLAKLTTDTVVDTRALVAMLGRPHWPSFAEALRESSDHYASA